MGQNQTNCIQIFYYPEQLKSFQPLQRILILGKKFYQDSQTWNDLDPNDARKMTYSKCIESINGYFYELIAAFAIIFPDTTDNFEAIMKPICNNRNDIKSIFNANKEKFVQYITTNFYIYFFSSFESSIRIVTRAGNFEDQKGNKISGTEDFYIIYRTIIE